MSKKPQRPKITGELRERVAEHVLFWITRNPGKQVPNTVIAKTFSIMPSQVGTCTKYLMAQGRIERVSPCIYRLAGKPVTPSLRKVFKPARPSIEQAPPQFCASINRGSNDVCKGFSLGDW